MSKKLKNRKNQTAKKLQKKKARQIAHNKISTSKQLSSAINIVDKVDDALELVSRGYITEGKKNILKLSKKHPNKSIIHFGLGVIAIQEELYLLAIEFFKSAVEKKSDFTEAYYNLGTCYKHEVKIAPMVYAYRMVIKTGRPDDLCVQKSHDLLNMLAKSANEETGMSLDDYVACNEIFDQGVEKMTQQSWEEAIQYFKEVIELIKNHAQSHGNLGICYAHIGENKLAIDVLEKALEIDPNYEVALVNLECVKNLKEGESLKGAMKIVDYYKDYSGNTTSYIN